MITSVAGSGGVFRDLTVTAANVEQRVMLFRPAPPGLVDGCRCSCPDGAAHCKQQTDRDFRPGSSRQEQRYTVHGTRCTVHGAR